MLRGSLDDRLTYDLAFLGLGVDSLPVLSGQRLDDTDISHLGSWDSLSPLPSAGDCELGSPRTDASSTTRRLLFKGP